MTQLEITTNKRLLIVEYPNDKSFQDDLSFYRQFKVGGFEQYIVEFICKGSDLTEDIARGFTHNMNFGTDENPDIGYHHSIKDNYWCESALESFISAIQSKIYHWGENPVKKPIYSTIIYGCLPGAYRSYVVDLKEWRESESRTFNPSKCIIFEIV